MTSWHPVPTDLPEVHVQPGELFCAPAPHLVTTILGSCVSVCLWDRRLGFGGLNHFILPEVMGDEQPSCRYGAVAVPMLVDWMRDLGSRTTDLQAKIFGGANVLTTARPEATVGSRNIEAALSLANRFGIPVVAKHLFGVRGVVIKQHTGTGEVWLRRIRQPPAAAGMPPPAQTTPARRLVPPQAYG